jgi:hypothetical protein
VNGKLVVEGVAVERVCLGSGDIWIGDVNITKKIPLYILENTTLEQFGKMTPSGNSVYGRFRLTLERIESEQESERQTRC